MRIVQGGLRVRTPDRTENLRSLGDDWDSVDTVDSGSDIDSIWEGPLWSDLTLGSRAAIFSIDGVALPCHYPQLQKCLKQGDVQD